MWNDCRLAEERGADYARRRAAAPISVGFRGPIEGGGVTARKATKKKSKAKRTRRTAVTSKRAPKSPAARRKRKKTPRGKKDPGGRPAIEWTEDVAKTIGKLAQFGNTVEDMARILRVSKSSLEEAIGKVPKVREAYYGGGAKLNDDLRRSQVTHAKAGNAMLLKWLGIQRLGQRDVKAVELSGTGEDGALKLEGDLGPVVVRKIVELLRSRGQR